MQKKWILLPQNPKLSILEQIASNRGIKNLKPRLADLSDPFEIPNIKAAAERTLSAIEKNENILIFGDYDVDGVTATAILLETLQYLGAKPDHYIPYRYQEGYSLNEKAVQKAKENNINLIITVDCGVSNITEIELANSLGMDVIVTDHHNIPLNLPPAHSIVNPKLIPADHPSKNLSGAGVAFKFAWALLREAQKKDNAFLTDLLDLAALGTIADVVPLTEENRILASAGLRVLNKKKRLGIKHLVEAAAVNGEISINHVNFALAPRINAAGRLEHASISLNLLAASNKDDAQAIAGELDSINRRRQDIGSRIQKEAVEQIELNNLAKNKVIILKGAGWHPGVIGIVASQIAEKYSRPAILIGDNRGSARSIAGVNIYNLLAGCQEFFSSFGGHAGAAGFEIEEKDYEKLCECLLQKAEDKLSDEDLTPKIYIDAELESSQLTLNLAKEINLLSPFGEGNPVPLFLTKELPLEEMRQVGTDKKHLKLKAGELDIIGFNLGPLMDSLSLSNYYDLVYNLECNEWNGFERIQLNLVDIKKSQ